MRINVNRWFYLCVGIVIFLLAGMVYAWSVLSLPIGTYFESWTKAQLSLTFTICMMSFCVGCMSSGTAMSKISVRWIVWISGILFFAGFSMAARANVPMILYIGYGVMCGFAAGFVYNTVLSTLSAWFPDRQGTVSGILLMGFGLSSFLVGKIYQRFTPSGVGIDEWRHSFQIFGIIILIVFIICGFFIVKPEKKDTERYILSERKNRVSGAENLRPAEMIRRKSFWFFFLWATCIGGIGMVLIGHASGIASEVGSQVSAGTIATTVGLISIFNGISRVFYGNLFDRKGRKITMILVGVAFALFSVVLLAAFYMNSYLLIIIGFIGCGFSYAGNNTTASAYVNAAYGMEYYSKNLPVMNLNLLPASLGGTIGGILYDMSGTYTSTLYFMLAGALLSLVFTFAIKDN